MIDIFSISNQEEFASAAMQLFKYQAAACEPYCRYIAMMGIDIESITSIEEIPFMPIALFKSCEVYSAQSPPERIFTSSATTGSIPSRHPMQSLDHYLRVCVEAFERQFGELDQWAIYALLPGYLEREGSSLIYMMEHFVAKSRKGGFYLRNHNDLREELKSDRGKKLLFGVSYALLDLLESSPNRKLNIDNLTVMETGGMKGMREEITKERLHKVLCNGFGVTEIASEYGMAELTSQAYATQNGLFKPPPWMKIVIRDVNDPLKILAKGERGGVNIIDLASHHSCAFIQCDDLARITEEGFKLEGRVNRSEIRGCNLLI